jgi:hypothetical protein
MTGLTHWLKGGTPDARFAPRIAEPSIFVYYWDGSVPEARKIRDISPTGAYILTNEHWYPGTIVRLIFRGYKTPLPPATDVVPSQSISLSSRVVRQEQDGAAVEFLFPTPKDRETLEKFIATMPKTSGALAIPPSTSNSGPDIN